MVWRFLNFQGAIGLAAALALGLLLLVQKGETRHWRKQSGQYEQLWKGEASAHQRTAANHLAAAAKRAESDARNIVRVRSEQNAISQRISHDFQIRLADARAAAGRVRQRTAKTATDPGGPGAAAMPGSAGAAARADRSAAQDGFPHADGLIATEQAIQLQALIDWVNAQSRLDHDGIEN